MGQQHGDWVGFWTNVKLKRGIGAGGQWDVFGRWGRRGWVRVRWSKLIEYCEISNTYNEGKFKNIFVLVCLGIYLF